ncbi:hypothetical protein PInf_019807 [Phytophthora infestans]|nr:hypothetical protein PInf_019807 [Phytophthora infestans]
MEFHSSMRVKSETDSQIPDEARCARNFPVNGHLWRIVADKYRWSEDLYDDIFQVCVGLTNFHIESNPLRDVNGEAYAQRENRLRTIGNTIKTKRRLSQDKYRSRKRLRHRMTLDDLPGHDDLICDSDDTQLSGY